jgi:hypothetical protein
MKLRKQRKRRPVRTLMGSAGWWRDKHQRARRQIAAGIEGAWFKDGNTASKRLVNSPY